MVNSLVHAAVKKVVVRHVKTAACKGDVRSNCVWMVTMVSSV